MQQKSKTWIEVSRKNLLHNLKVFRNIVKPKTKIMCVLKANAYGHGWKEVVSVLKGEADWFGVDGLDEALQIRSIDKNTPVLVLGHIPSLRLKEAISKDISFVVYDKNLVDHVIKINLNQKARLHLKVETGLNRQGLKDRDAQDLTRFIKKNKDKIKLEGIYSHFANVEDTLDPSFAMAQLKEFKKIAKKVESVWGAKCVKHIAASASSMLYDESHFDMIRLGISLYGYWPSRETQIELKMRRENKFKLKPVMSWKSVVSQVKNIEVGESVGYGRTWYALTKSKIAIIPVGYYDGYDRGLSNNSRVLIKGQSAPVVGRIAMNMFAADVTNIKKIKTGDKVVIIGRSASLEITVDELAGSIQTINYEVISRLNQLITRIVI